MVARSSAAGARMDVLLCSFWDRWSSIHRGVAFWLDTNTKHLMGSMEKLLQSIPSTLMESLLPMTNLASTSDLEQPVIMSVHATQVIQTLSPHLLAIVSVQCK